MEYSTTQTQPYSLDFKGSGSHYFGIIIANWFLTIFTLGIYYPWAKARNLQFMYGSSTLNNENFGFHGTGKEMFKGFVIGLMVLLALGAIASIFMFIRLAVVGVIFIYVALLLLAPIAIHGSYRYKMAKTSWRGIRFGYVGVRNEFIKEFFIGLFFTIITIGLYGPWFIIRMRNYLLSHIRFGNVKFEYKADGLDYFLLNLKGYFFTIITIGIYFFWWQRDSFAFYINHLTLKDDQGEIRIKSEATAGDFFKLIVVNMLLLIVTLGLGYAWVVARGMKFIMSKIRLEGDINLNSIQQSDATYVDSAADSIGDLLNIDTVI